MQDTVGLWAGGVHAAALYFVTYFNRDCDVPQSVGSQRIGKASASYKRTGFAFYLTKRTFNAVKNIADNTWS